MMLVIKKRVNINGYHIVETHITCEQELLDWINTNFAKVDKYIRLNDNVMSAINLVDSITYYDLKILLMSLNNGACHNVRPEYWLNRGYTLDEARQKIKEVQSCRSNKFVLKKKLEPEKYDSIIPNQIGYWLKRGYNKEEATALVKDRQITFSLETCIQKYGEIEGKRRFDERQLKWQHSRKTSLKNGKWHTSSCIPSRPTHSIKFLIEDFGIGWIDEHIKRSAPKNKRKLDLYVKISDALKLGADMRKYIESLPFEDVLVYAKTPIAKYLISDDVISVWCEANGTRFQRNSYGNQYWYKGHYLKSDGEFIIARWLFESSIDFSTNGSYPGTRRAYDYYLPKYDLYIELAGMQEDVYIDKKKFLTDAQWRVLWIKSLNDLKIYLHEKNNKY
jgi:hypothetical protein